MLFFSPELKCWFHSDHLNVPIPNTTLACSIERATAEKETDKINWAALSEYKTRFEIHRNDVLSSAEAVIMYLQSALEKELLLVDRLFDDYSARLSCIQPPTSQPVEEHKAEIIRNFVQAKEDFISKLRETGCSTEEAKILARTCLNAIPLEYSKKEDMRHD